MPSEREEQLILAIKLAMDIWALKDCKSSQPMIDVANAALAAAKQSGMERAAVIAEHLSYLAAEAIRAAAKG